ncbi:MAG TPA: hypothetical protein VFL80_02680, partial [Thermoanaerobaculia bacterium]|nr:hypothetical protein [Thermoanaerobaculia bacterium]
MFFSTSRRLHADHRRCAERDASTLPRRRRHPASVLLLASLFALLSASPAAAARITGVVVAEDGTPVANAQVISYAPESGRAFLTRALSSQLERVPLGSTESGADGKFSLDIGSTAAVDLLVKAKDRETHEIAAVPGGDLGALVLRKTMLRRVTVKAGGKALAGAKLHPNQSTTITTGEDGTAQLPAARPSSQQLWVIHPDHPPTPFIWANQEVLELQPAETVRGKVLAEDAKAPVAGAVIEIDQVPVAITGEDGTFTTARAAKG